MRIQYDGEPDDPENIDSALITAIDLVSLPDKKVVASLLPKDDVGTTYSEVTLLWSTDSKWCAFYYAQPRLGYTSVFQCVRGAFKTGDEAGKTHGPCKGRCA